MDPATALLAENLPGRDGRWLDLGCGSGALSVAAARPDRALTGVDWSYTAVETTQRTLAANGCAADVRLADGAPSREPLFDVVICYPPFHVGPRVDHGPAVRLIRTARDRLAPDGELRVVLTSAQSPRDLLTANFRDVTPVAAAHGCQVFSCARPTGLARASAG